MSKSLLCLLSGLLLLASCAQKQPQAKAPISATKEYKGILHVDADPGLAPSLQHQQEVFEFQHDSVKLDIQYKNEAEILDDFRNKRASTIILARALDSLEQKDLISNDTLYVREIKIAYDAVALVGNKAFDDSRLDIEKLKQYFSPIANAANSPAMVFEGQQSSAVKFVLKTLGYKEKVSGHVYALKSVADVIDYVKNDKNAIGFIPYNFLSSEQDTAARNVLESIKILSLHAKDKSGYAVSVSANQSDIATGDYPLKRNIYAGLRFTYEDNLDWLFVNFLYKERGARIFLKDGLVPARMPARDIDVNTDGLKAVNN